MWYYLNLKKVALMTVAELEKEVRDLKRRVDLAETRMAQNDGRFEFITGQLRDVQLYLHTRFADMDGQFAQVNSKIENIDSKIEKMDVKIDALPRVIAEMITKRD